MDQPLVSIILPVYNAQNHLARCIGSILNQTYKNIELIILNDGSKDHSLPVCEEFRARDSRIVLVDKENSGVSDTRNLGLKLAGGESPTAWRILPSTPTVCKTLKVPQIGWNALHIVRDDPLFRYIREGEYVYYVHSYYGKNCTGSTLAVSDYSIPVTGVVRAGRVYGTQFHPEKSGETGLRILKAFAEL